ncbi:MAG: hypothetical protein ACJASX_004022 [Limisphaerales bacterium]|jgi:hypothetical protein
MILSALRAVDFDWLMAIQIVPTGGELVIS